MGSPPAKTQGKIEWIETDDIFADLPEVPSLIAGLDFQHGRPVIFASYGSGGKTVAAQAMTLALVTGSKVWGAFEVPKPLRVGHVDSDQGRYATKKRYQRLLKGMGLEREAIGARLRLSVMPDFNFLQLNAEDLLRKVIETDRLDLLWLDAYRRLIPGLDENDSRAAVGFEKATRVSDKTGVPILILAHAGKNSDNSPEGVLRGTSSLFDASGAIYAFDGDPKKSKTVTHVRPSASYEGELVAPFRLKIEGDKHGPLTVLHIDIAKEALAQKAKHEARESYNELTKKVLEYVKANPGKSGRDVEGAIQGKASSIREALSKFVERGVMTRTGEPKTGFRYATTLRVVK